MTNKSVKFLKVINNINKSLLLNYVVTAVRKVSEKYQKKMFSIQNLNTGYGYIVKQINDTSIVQDLKTATLEPSPPLPKRIVHWWKWYQQLTGLDVVEKAKQNVINIQDKLFQCQENRRSLTQQTTIINNKIKDIYGELLNTKRNDPKYVQLTISENKGLQELQKISERLNQVEKELNDYFTHLATAVKEYHDAQTVNSQKYKYLSLGISVLLSFMSIIGSMTYNNVKLTMMNKSMINAQKQNESNIKALFQSLEQKLRSSEQHPQPLEENEVYKHNIETVKIISFYMGLAIIGIFILQKLS